MRRLTMFGFVAAVALAGCSEAPAANDTHGAELAELTQAVRELRDANAELAETVRRQGLDLTRLQRAQVERRAVAGAAAAAATGEAATPDELAASGAALDADAPADAVEDEAVARLLESETGKQAIQQAAAREIERREAGERRTFVSYQVGMFAQRAGLDDRQTERLQAIWKDSLDEGVELRKEFAALRTLPESQRDAARETAMENMRRIGRERTERVRELLTPEQYTEYEKAEEEIVAGLHGGPRRASR